MDRDLGYSPNELVKIGYMMNATSDDSINALAQSWDYYNKIEDINHLKIHIDNISDWKVKQ